MGWACALSEKSLTHFPDRVRFPYMVTDADLNEYAEQLVFNLQGLLDVLDGVGLGEVLHPVKDRPASEMPLCLISDLDFMTIDGEAPITGKTKRSSIRRQLDICEACSQKDPCLEIAITEKREFGIWGGKLPHEVTALRRQRK